MNKLTDLEGKSIVITGASSGAGKAMALEFAKYQVNLVISARNETALHEVRGECEQLGAKVLVVIADTSDAKAMINLAAEAIRWQDRIDIWINNAGVLAAGNFDVVPMLVHEQVIKTNLLGYMNGAHAVLPYFKEQGWGTLINNISVGGYLPVPYGTGYTASKFGLRGWSQALKGELAAWKHIHVCDLFPSFLDTPGIKHAANYKGKVLKPAPPVYDPVRLARAVAKVAANPVSNTYVGSTSVLLKLSHALFPELTTKIASAVMQSYFNVAKPLPLSDGNILNSVKYGTSIHGGFGIPGKPRAHQKYIAGALLTGLVAGYLLFQKRK